MLLVVERWVLIQLVQFESSIQSASYYRILVGVFFPLECYYTASVKCQVSSAAAIR